MSGDFALPKQFLRSCLLLLLAERPDYGYDLLERVRAFGFDGVDQGGMYRALRALEREQLVRSAWRYSAVGPYRRVYEVTDLGRLELARSAGKLARAQQILGAYLERHQQLTADWERTPTL